MVPVMKLKDKLKLKNRLLRECLAEFLGTFVLMVIGTATLLLCILPLDDSRNSPAPEGLQPLLVGFVVLGIGMAMSSNCGGAINPARDLGPRLFTLVAGWGPEVFTAFKNWWWIPVVAPLIGGVTGASLYQLFIEFHHEDPETDQPEAKTRENGTSQTNLGDSGSYLTSKF